MNIYEKMLEVMKDVTYIQKKGKIKSSKMSYSAILNDDVVASIRPYLIKHGLVLIPSIVEHKLDCQDGKLISTVTADVRLVNANKPEEEVTTQAVGYGIDFGDKGVGKAYTYAVKYAVIKLFFFETGENEESRIGGYFQDDHIMETGRFKGKAISKIPKNQLKEHYSKYKDKYSVTDRAKIEALLGVQSEDINDILKYGVSDE